MSQLKTVMSHDPLADLEAIEDVTPAAKTGLQGSTGPQAPNAGFSDGVLLLDSNITIAEVTAYQARLQQSLESGGPEKIDGREVEAIDGAGLQLLIVFVRELVEKSVVVQWLGVSETLQEAACDYGVASLLQLDNR